MKLKFCICENKDADQLISVFVFATWIVQFLQLIYPKFQACSFLWLCSPIFVELGKQPGRPVFWLRGTLETEYG